MISASENHKKKIFTLKYLWDDERTDKSNRSLKPSPQEVKEQGVNEHHHRMI